MKSQEDTSHLAAMLLTALPGRSLRPPDWRHRTLVAPCAPLHPFPRLQDSIRPSRRRSFLRDGGPLRVEDARKRAFGASKGARKRAFGASKDARKRAFGASKDARKRPSGRLLRMRRLRPQELWHVESRSQ